MIETRHDPIRVWTEGADLSLHSDAVQELVADLGPVSSAERDDVARYVAFLACLDVFGFWDAGDACGEPGREVLLRDWRGAIAVYLEAHPALWPVAERQLSHLNAHAFDRSPIKQAPRRRYREGSAS